MKPTAHSRQTFTTSFLALNVYLVDTQANPRKENESQLIYLCDIYHRLNYIENVADRMFEDKLGCG